MKQLLAAANRPVLWALASANAALVFDFDGTLAPYVDDPARARLPRRTRALLARTAARYPCAVISGRAQSDVARRLDGLSIDWIIGSHGVDWGWTPSDGERLAAQVAGWRRLLAPLAHVPGVFVEDKRFSLAIHYRGAAAKRRVFAVMRTLRPILDDAHTYLGREVVNVVAANAPHKGAALLSLIERLRCDMAMYVGDDTTDEDVFALADPARVLTVRVGMQRGSRAGWYLRGQHEIDALLRVLLDARPRPVRSSASAGALRRRRRA